MSRRGAEYSPRRHERNEQRAVGDAGPYGVRLSGCAGIRETADMDATVPLHDNRPARLRVGHGSGSGSYRRVPEPVIARHPRGAWERQRGWGYKRFLMGLFASYHVRRKGIPKTMGLWRRFCILLPPRAKGCRAGARNIPARGTKGTSNGPSGTSAPTGCVHRGAPVFGKPPIWAQQSRCTITDRRVSAWGAGAAAGMGAEAIPYGPFCVVSRSA